MKLVALGSALAFFITIVVAGPIPGSAELFARALPGLCGTHQYDDATAQNAYGDAIAILSQYPPPFIYSGGTPYPHYFGNGERLSMPSTCTAGNVIDLQEYPIFRDGSDFTTDRDPELDRVVIARIANGAQYLYAQCRLMTHEGAPTRNGFVECN